MMCQRHVEIRASGDADYGVLRRARIQFDSSTWADGRIFVVGGRELPPGEGLVTATTAEYYLPAAGRWFETPPLPKPIFAARSFALSEQEALVVDLESGTGLIWSFPAKAWRPTFSLARPVSRAVMHSSRRLLALVEAKPPGRAQLFVFDPAKKSTELLDSPLPFAEGAGLVELADQRVLESQPHGLALWDLKKKKATRLRE
jgi:hypothetical protein